MVGRDRLREQRQLRVAVAGLEVAQHLVVGPVLLDDVDDVLHPPAHRRHHRLGRIGLRPGRHHGVGPDAGSQPRQSRAGGRRQRQQRACLLLQDVLAARPAPGPALGRRLQRVAAAARVRPRQPLEIGHRQAAAGDRDGVGIPAGRDQTGERCRRARRPAQRLAQVDRSNRIEAAERHPQPVAGKRQTVGVEPLRPVGRAVGAAQDQRVLGDGATIGGQRDQRIGVVAGRQHAAVGQRQQRGRLALRLRPGGDAEAVVGQRQRDQFAVAWATDDGAPRRGHGDAERIGAARTPALRRVELARAQVDLGDHPPLGEVDPTDRVVEEVGHQQPRRRRPHHPRGRRLDAQPEPFLVPERDRRAIGRQFRAVPGEGQHRIADPERDSDPMAVRRPGEPGETCRQRHLGEPGRALGIGAEDHQPLGRMRPVGLAVGRRHAVEPAGQQRDQPAVGRGGERGGIGDGDRPRTTVERPQRGQHGAACGQRRQADVRRREVVVGVARHCRHGRGERQHRHHRPSHAHRRTPLPLPSCSPPRRTGKCRPQGLRPALVGFGDGSAYSVADRTGVPSFARAATSAWWMHWASAIAASGPLSLDVQTDRAALSRRRSRVARPALLARSRSA